MMNLSKTMKNLKIHNIAIFNTLFGPKKIFKIIKCVDILPMDQIANSMMHVDINIIKKLKMLSSMYNNAKTKAILNK